MFTLNIYIPTRNRYLLLLERLYEIQNQIERLNLALIDIKVSVSINCDNSYNINIIENLCDEVIFQDYDIGADLNINFGFFSALRNRADFLWIIGDDEPLSPNALSIICNKILSNPKVDLIVGIKEVRNCTSEIDSLFCLNKFCDGTLSFISSTIYRVKFDLNMVACTSKLAFTSYCHLAMLHLLIYEGLVTNLAYVHIQDIVDYHYKVLVDPLKPRSAYSYRDSVVFFGKILSTLVIENPNYVKRELILWWRENWHRVSMYLDKQDFRGFLLYGISNTYLETRFLALISRFPFWRIKDIIRPVPKSRENSLV